MSDISKNNSYLQLLHLFRKKIFAVKFCSECDSLVRADMDIVHLKMLTKNKDTFWMKKKNVHKRTKKWILGKSSLISTTKRTRSPHIRPLKKLE